MQNLKCISFQRKKIRAFTGQSIVLDYSWQILITSHAETSGQDKLLQQHTRALLLSSHAHSWMYGRVLHKLCGKLELKNKLHPGEKKNLKFMQFFITRILDELLEDASWVLFKALISHPRKITSASPKEDPCTCWRTPQHRVFYYHPEFKLLHRPH